MDTTETYIKMRSKAVPDLGHGTIAANPLPQGCEDGIWVDKAGNWFIVRYGVLYCQLERQEQLQVMSDFGKFFKNNPVGMVKAMECRIEQKYEDELEDRKWFNYWYDCNSMEQLWLAFVMKENHNKTWDGEKWSLIA